MYNIEEESIVIPREEFVQKMYEFLNGCCENWTQSSIWEWIEELDVTLVKEIEDMFDQERD